MSELDALRAEPYRYSLFAALRLIERTFRDAPRLARSTRATEEPVRISQRPHLMFAPSDVCGVDEDGKLRVEEYSFGLLGPNGPMPLHLTELALHRSAHYGDPALARFLDLFNHRFAAIFFRAWAETDPATCADRPDDDQFRAYLAALNGLAHEQARGRDSVGDEAKLARSDLLGARVRSADRLETLLGEYFGIPVRIREFVGSWLDIPSDEQLRLGQTSSGSAVGLGATLGSMSWQRQNKFEIVIGPLDLEQFRDLLPGTPALAELLDLARLYTHDEWSWQMRLELRQAAGLGTALFHNPVGTDNKHRGTHLGWTSWLGKSPAVANDVVVQDFVGVMYRERN